MSQCPLNLIKIDKLSFIYTAFDLHLGGSPMKKPTSAKVRLIYNMAVDL